MKKQQVRRFVLPKLSHGLDRLMFPELYRLRCLLFPELSPGAVVTREMINERLADMVDIPTQVENKILTLRRRGNNGDVVYWIEES